MNEKIFVFIGVAFVLSLCTNLLLAYRLGKYRERLGTYRKFDGKLGSGGPEEKPTAGDAKDAVERIRASVARIRAENASVADGSSDSICCSGSCHGRDDSCSCKEVD